MSARLAREDTIRRAPVETFRALGDRLRALGYEAAHEATLKFGKGVAFELRPAIRRFRLRQSDASSARALRLFTFDDELTRAEADDALTPALLEALAAADVVVADGDRVTARLTVTPSDGLLVLSDRLAHGADAVMGPGATTTAMFRVATPATTIERALDLGCGAGTAALHLAKRTRHVIGTDVNERAVTLSRVNAILNRVDNVEFRAGDLFAPVAGLRFDRVVSQPPFIAQPEGADAVTYLYGGARGDELMLRLLADLPPYLADRGRAVLLTQWQRTDTRAVPELVRDALGSGPSIFSIEPPELAIDDYCAQYSSMEHPALDERYVHDALRFRDHMQRIGARATTQSVLVIAADGANIASTIPLSSTRIMRLSSARVDARLAVEQLLARADHELLASRLRLAAGVRVERVIGPPGDPPSFAAENPDDPLVATTNFNVPTRDLIVAVNREPDVATAIARVAAQHRVPAAASIGTLLPIVKGALRQGLLDVAVS